MLHINKPIKQSSNHELSYVRINRLNILEYHWTGNVLRTKQNQIYLNLFYLVIINYIVIVNKLILSDILVMVFVLSRQILIRFERIAVS